jgi:hypothetical protein
MKLVGHAVRMSDENCVKKLVRKPEWRRPLVDLIVDGRIILKWFLGNRL